LLPLVPSRREKRHLGGRQVAENRIMLTVMGLALRSAFANGGGGVTRPEYPCGSAKMPDPLRRPSFPTVNVRSSRRVQSVPAEQCGERSFPMAMTGTVKFFNGERGYGFIKPDDGGRDVFVHITAVERAGLKDLTEGQRITFEVEPDKKGKGPKAVDLVISS
jgi:CspA family cold shock protein